MKIESAVFVNSIDITLTDLNSFWGFKETKRNF